MGAFKNLVGQTFGRLSVLERAGNRSGGGNTLWRCLCICGNVVNVRGDHLSSGAIRSCGCLRIEFGKAQAQRNTKSGHLARIQHLGGLAHGPTAGRIAKESGQLWNAHLKAESMKQDTKPELIVKDNLDALGIRYTHQYNLNGKFLVDFYLPDSNTIIEVDGCYWHKCAECGFGDGRPRDRSRNAYIQACGYKLEIVKEHELEV